MRSNSLVTFVLLATVAGSSLAAPSPAPVLEERSHEASETPVASDIEARAGAGIGALVSSAGKGLLTGAGLAALTTFIENKFGGGDSGKRELTGEDIAVLQMLAGAQAEHQARDIDVRAGFGGLLASAGKGLLTGAGLAGLTTFLQNELGGGSSKRDALDADQLAVLQMFSNAQSEHEARDLAVRAGFGSLLASAGKGLLTGAGIAGLTTFLQNELGGGSSKREPLNEDQLAVLQMLANTQSEHEARDLAVRAGFGSLLASAGKGLLTGAGLAGLTTFLQNELGSGSSKRDALNEDQLAVLQMLAGDHETRDLAARAGFGSLLASAGKGLLTGAGIAGLTTFLQNELGGNSGKRAASSDEEYALLQMIASAQSDHQARGLGSLFVKGGEDIASILGKAIAGGVGSGVGASVINGIFGGGDDNKRDIVNHFSPVSHGSGGNFPVGPISDSLMNDLFGSDAGKRAPVNPLVGLLLGQGASFGVSELVQNGIEKVEDLFKGGKRGLSLNDLD